MERSKRVEKQKVESNWELVGYLDELLHKLGTSNHGRQDRLLRNGCRALSGFVDCSAEPPIRSLEAS